MSQQKLELHLEFQAIIMINVLIQSKKGKRSLIKLWFLCRDYLFIVLDQLPILIIRIINQNLSFITQ